VNPIEWENNATAWAKHCDTCTRPECHAAMRAALHAAAFPDNTNEARAMRVIALAKEAHKQ